MLGLCGFGSLDILVHPFLEADHEQTGHVEKLRSISQEGARRGEDLWWFE